MTFFEHVPLAPSDPIFGLNAAFYADQREKKVNLGVGYFKDDMLRTPILACVKEAEKILLESEPNKEYLPIDGHKALIEKVGELVFGKAFWQSERSRIAGFQTVGGTGALKLAGTFCHEEIHCPLFLPSSTWANHRAIFTGCQIPVLDYPYFNAQSHHAFNETLAFLMGHEASSIILLHASCHNPTGIDPTFDQWKELLSVIKQKRMIPFFDFAYQGFGRGIDEDAKAVRLFAENGCEMFVAVSAAKNFSLYGERVGALFILTENPQIAERVTSRAKQMIRTNYSNPPRHGASVVAHILSDNALRAQWIAELEGMRKRIVFMRRELAGKLSAQGKKSVKDIEEGLGMFCMIDLKKDQVDRLISEYGIYMPSDGRINISGLNAHNIDYVVNALLNVS